MGSSAQPVAHPAGVSEEEKGMLSAKTSWSFVSTSPAVHQFIPLRRLMIWIFLSFMTMIFLHFISRGCTIFGFELQQTRIMATCYQSN
jgi:hypothetical protein